MSRRRRSPIRADLFPFLSVLFCAIGVVIFVMSIQSLFSLEGPHEQRVVIRGGSGGQEPVYVECRSDAVVLHPSGTSVPFDAERGLGEIPGSLDNAFIELLEQLAASDDGRYIVFLVRPDGVEAFETSRELAQTLNVDIGKDAVLSGGRLVFTDESGAPTLEEAPR